MDLTNGSPGRRRKDRSFFVKYTFGGAIGCNASFARIQVCVVQVDGIQFAIDIHGTPIKLSILSTLLEPRTVLGGARDTNSF
jgi:hypothetical protein